MEPELALTSSERRVLRVGFWVSYLMGPLTAAIAPTTLALILGVLPASFRPLAQMINDQLAIWAPLFCGGIGAAYCFARLCGRRSNEEVLAFTSLGSVVVVISYLLLLILGNFAAWLVCSLFMR